jgi:hypothetical protein
MMLAPDREEVRAVARRYFAAGLGCALETQREGRWEPCVLALRSASPNAVLEEVEKTLARGVRVRLAAYSPSSLTRIDLPAPVMCPELRHDLHADLVLVARGTRVLDG